MKALYTIAVLALFLSILVWFYMPKTPDDSEHVACTMEAKICPDGSAVGRTGPNCEFAPCPDIPLQPIYDNLIRIDTPVSNQKVTSPITVRGQARGNWFFEASFPIVIVNWDGLIIGQGIATAQDEWMTTEFVPFTAQISYTLPPDTPYNRGALILKKDNPSGLPEYDDSREIPITFEMSRP